MTRKTPGHAAHRPSAHRRAPHGLAALALGLAPMVCVHAADDPPANVSATVSADAKSFGEAVKRDAKIVAKAAKDGAHQVAVGAKEVAHEVAGATKHGAEQVSAAAKRGAEKTKAAVKPDKTDSKPPP